MVFCQFGLGASDRILLLSLMTFVVCRDLLSLSFAGLTYADGPLQSYILLAGLRRKLWEGRRTLNVLALNQQRLHFEHLRFVCPTVCGRSCGIYLELKSYNSMSLSVVKHCREAALDAHCVSSIANLGQQKVQALPTGFDTFNVVEFSQKLVGPVIFLISCLYYCRYHIVHIFFNCSYRCTCS